MGFFSKPLPDEEVPDWVKKEAEKERLFIEASQRLITFFNHKTKKEFMTIFSKDIFIGSKKKISTKLFPRGKQLYTVEFWIFVPENISDYLGWCKFAGITKERGTIIIGDAFVPYEIKLLFFKG